MKTLYLDPASWDLRLDSTGSIAVADAPYQLAQDAASAILTFIGECFYDKSLGVPYFDQILGHTPSLALMKARFEAAALTVPGVVSAKAYIQRYVNRTVTGTVHVTDRAGATTSAAF